MERIQAGHWDGDEVGLVWYAGMFWGPLFSRLEDIALCLVLLLHCVPVLLCDFKAKKWEFIKMDLFTHSKTQNNQFIRFLQLRNHFSAIVPFMF